MLTHNALHCIPLVSSATLQGCIIMSLIHPFVIPRRSSI